MAQDIILGRTKRNWARGSSALPPPEPTSDEVTLRMTPTETAWLSDIAATMMRADAGDRQALVKIASLTKKIAQLRKKASRGDASARRTLLILKESGVFRGTQTFSLGADSVSNLNYRAAVFKRALRGAHGKRPTTKDFYRAKSEVDGAMRQIGLSIYLPGARRGRITA